MSDASAPGLSAPADHFRTILSGYCCVALSVVNITLRSQQCTPGGERGDEVGHGRGDPFRVLLEHSRVAGVVRSERGAVGRRDLTRRDPPIRIPVAPRVHAVPRVVLEDEMVREVGIGRAQLRADLRQAERLVPPRDPVATARHASPIDLRRDLRRGKRGQALREEAASRDNGASHVRRLHPDSASGVETYDMPAPDGAV